MIVPDSPKVQKLVDLGFSKEQAKAALSRFDELDRAAEWLFSDPSPSDLAPVIGPKPPAYAEAVSTGWEQVPAAAAASKPSTPPASPELGAVPQSKVQLTLPAPPERPGTPPGLPTTTTTTARSAEDDDIAKAIELSRQDQRQPSIPMVDLTADDEDISKAMKLSMASLKSQDEDIGIPFANDPSERVRAQDIPVALRSISPSRDPVCAYLQCLYASPTLRHYFLSFRPSERAFTDGPRSVEGYWKSQHDPLTDEARRVFGLESVIALQRLFAVMALSKRAYVHVGEIEQALGLTRDVFGSKATENVYSLHQAIIDQLQQALAATRGVPEPVARAEVAPFFMILGRELLDDDHLGLPLPAPDPANDGSVYIPAMKAKSDAFTYPNTLYDALDRVLVYRARYDDTVDTFALAYSMPRVLVVSIEHVDQGAPPREWLSPADRHILDIPEQMWLDRYSIKNRAKVSRLRKQGAELEHQRRDLIARRQKLVNAQHNCSATELVERARGGLLAASQAIDTDETRLNRQKTLAQTFSAVLDRIMERQNYYDETIERLTKEIEGLFETEDMKQHGPYQLRGIVMANGLNGRGSSWSVTRDHKGRWWKVTDAWAKEISLQEALQDRSGVGMNMGPVMVLYELDRPDSAVPTGNIPAHLVRAISQDNASFASELPEAVTQDWSSTAIDDPSLAVDAEDEALLSLPAGAAQSETVDQLIDLDSEATPRMQAQSTNDLSSSQTLDPTVMSNPVTSPDHPHSQSEALPPSTADTISGTATPMSLDSDAAINTDASMEELESDEVTGHGPMRLRGGASDTSATDSSDDDYEDDEEDEVELGLLRPMTEDWDVDLSVGKVGGMPRWLDPSSPLSAEQVQCAKCKKHQRLVLQINSPDDEREHASARTLYLFACRNVDCVSTTFEGSVSLWRIQMPSPNDFYPLTDEAKRLRSSLESELSSDGFRSQVEFGGPAWPEHDMYCESEPYADLEDEVSDDSDSQGKITELSNEDDDDDDDDDDDEFDANEEETTTGVDKAFLSFQDRITSRCPNQVLRFYRLPGVTDPKPLMVSSETVSDDEVSPCELCGAKRKVEFQVLGTILSYMNEYNLPLDSWYAFTCEANCEIAKGAGDKTGWAKESVVSRKFDDAGISLRQ